MIAGIRDGRSANCGSPIADPSDLRSLERSCTSSDITILDRQISPIPDRRSRSKIGSLLPRWAPTSLANSKATWSSWTSGRTIAAGSEDTEAPIRFLTTQRDPEQLIEERMEARFVNMLGVAGSSWQFGDPLG